MPTERGADGTFSASVTDEDFVFFFETGERPFYGTGEVAAEFDLSNTQTRRRLDDLCAAGELERVELDNRRTLWWRRRDVVTIRSETDGYSAHDTASGVASGGSSRPAALRNLAEAIESHQSAEDSVDVNTYEELDIDSTDTGGEPPF